MKTIFLCYGEGGHKAQIERLFHLLKSECDGITYIGLCEGKNTSKQIRNYKLLPMRSKYNTLFTFFLCPAAFVYNLVKIIALVAAYKPVGLISTGPGSVLMPALIFKALRKKVVYIETWSRFTTKSLSGKFMYRLSDKFYVQNESLLNLFPDASYSGVL